MTGNRKNIEPYVAKIVDHLDHEGDKLFCINLILDDKEYRKAVALIVAKERDLHLQRFAVTQMLTVRSGMLLIKQSGKYDLAKAGDVLLSALLIHGEYPMAWEQMAWFYLHSEDRVAAQWANKVLRYKITPTTPSIVRKLWEDPDTELARDDLREGCNLYCKYV